VVVVEDFLGGGKKGLVSWGSRVQWVGLLVDCGGGGEGMSWLTSTEM
jgi:hypothetical protein